MANIRNTLEKAIESFTLIIYTHRFKTLCILLVTIILLLAQIRHIIIDTSIESFLHEEDPALINYYKFREQFGKDEVVTVAIRSENIFSFQFLKKLKQLHMELQDNVPYIDDINSLINARNTRGEGDTLIVEDLLENWPRNEKQLEEIKQRALDNQMYKNTLISESAKLTAIIIRTHSFTAELQDQNDLMDSFDETEQSESSSKKQQQVKKQFLTDEENSEVIYEIRKIVNKYSSPDFITFIAGTPVVTHFTKQSMMKDMRKFMILAVLTICIFLFIMFRKISGVIFPIIIVVLSFLSTIAVMAIFGVPITGPIQILPSFILVVGVSSSVHILAIFYHRLKISNDKKDAIGYAMGHSGLAVFMTNFTTACGFMSFATAEIAPVADLGILAGVGVLITFFYTFFLLPPLLSIVPISKTKFKEQINNYNIMDRVLGKITDLSINNSYKILFITSLMTLVSIPLIAKIQFSHDPLSWFSKDNEIRMATETLDQEMRGTLNLEVLIDTNQENGLYNPELLNRIEKSVNSLEKIHMDEIFVGKAWSITTILKEINQALNENRQEFYAIPQYRDLVAQEFILFENSGSDDLEDVVDSQFKMARLTAKGPFKDAYKYGTFLTHIEKDIKKQFPDVNITITGLIPLLAKIMSNTIIGMAKSYVIALIIISILMMLLTGNIRIGLLSMIPNLVPILIALAAIGGFGLPMDLFTMMVASIAIGLAVDDTIHFMHNFRRYYEDYGDPEKAIRETLQTAGRAMLVTSIVLSLGFYIYAFATMQNIIRFGLLASSTIILALLADFFVAPALMIVLNKKEIDTTNYVTNGVR